MSMYVNISYPTKDENEILKECIKFIGKKYGKDQRDLLDSGVAYLAKKVKGASKRSIKFMYRSKKIKGSDSRQWKFKKNSYERAYRYIIYILSNDDNDGIKKVAGMLKLLYLQRKKEFVINNCLSDILVLQQKEALFYAVNKPQFDNDRKIIKKILRCYLECDNKNEKLLR